ncbi:MAG TPA: PadR family transcriptional regulator [Candidatus Bilamarchaeaceae archaeon]|nr:PadR family transcriptional regulator [Candidatus Bilamarchaeaceae archaeon]
MPETRPLKRLRRHLSIENLWLYILSLIRRKECYAYTLPEMIEKEYGFRPSRVMVYIVLHMLEGEGLIKGEQKERRKYYRLTEKGKNTLEEAKTELKSLSGKL